MKILKLLKKLFGTENSDSATGSHKTKEQSSPTKDIITQSELQDIIKSTQEHRKRNEEMASKIKENTRKIRNSTAKKLQEIQTGSNRK